jgi:hypothetical protein
LVELPPNGAYVARVIQETFGVDSLFPAVRNPAAFLRTYAAVERKRGNPGPFSVEAMRVIESLEERHWKRSWADLQCRYIIQSHAAPPFNAAAPDGRTPELCNELTASAH